MMPGGQTVRNATLKPRSRTFGQAGSAVTSPALAAHAGLVQTSPMTLFRISLLAALIAIVSGCGFHLRSRIMLPADVGPVQVTSRTSYSTLAEQVANGLRASGASIAPEDATDVAALSIISERWGNRAIAIDANGRAQEYSLRFAAIFMLTRADGSVLVPQQVIELSRDYVSPPQNATGTDTEREILAEELRREMAASILRRVDSVVRARLQNPVQDPAAPTSTSTSDSEEMTMPAPAQDGDAPASLQLEAQPPAASEAMPAPVEASPAVEPAHSDDPT